MRTETIEIEARKKPKLRFTDDGEHDFCVEVEADIFRQGDKVYDSPVKVKLYIEKKFLR